MRGRAKFTRPKLTLDERYSDPLVSKLINKVMERGKKAIAAQIVYQALEKLSQERSMPPSAVLRQVVDKASPILEVRSRRVGGATYQVPMEVRPARKVILVMRWLIEAARTVKGKPMADALHDEMRNILAETGTVMKKREDLHKMAEANRAFAHFARY